MIGAELTHTFHCLQSGCPGHDNSRLVCIDPDRYGSPYDIELRYLQRHHALTAMDMKIAQLEDLVVLARRFNKATDFRHWGARLRALRERREQMDVV